MESALALLHAGDAKAKHGLGQLVFDQGTDGICFRSQMHEIVNAARTRSDGLMREAMCFIRTWHSCVLPSSLADEGNVHRELMMMGADGLDQGVEEARPPGR